jgi:iron complex transport system ATP-binding protein
MSLLNCQQLCIQVADKLLCRELSFNIATGEVWGLLGPSGAGKTTLLHTLAGLHRPTAGSVRYQDTAIDQLEQHSMALHRGLLLQDNSEPFPGTVLAAVMTGRHPHLRPWQWESATDERLSIQALETVGLAGFEQRELVSLSGGERQRVAIAALLTQDPRLLMLDEPTTHLDLHHGIQLMAMLRRLAGENGKGVLMVLHDPALAARYCDKVVLLFGDGNHLSGPGKTLLQADHLSRLYHHPLVQIDTKYGPLFVPAD